MKELGIDWGKKTVKHEGVEISLGSVKGKIKDLAPEIVKEFVFDKTFNKFTGDIEFKIAWDSVFFEYHKKYGLVHLFNHLLKESGYHGKRK